MIAVRGRPWDSTGDGVDDVTTDDSIISNCLFINNTLLSDSLVIGDGSLTGISNKLFKSSLQVYPNPATDEFRIDADVKSLSVYNSIGQEVATLINGELKNIVVKWELVDETDIKE